MLDIRLLGGFAATISGRPIEVDTRKALALLAYLAVEGSATRDLLATLFWGESPHDRARATLRRTLSALRGATGTSMIAADRDVVSLTGDVTSDLGTLADELEATTRHDHDRRDVCNRCIPRLRRATELYRGEFLDGFSVKASPEFDDWVRSVSESTRLQVGTAFDRLGTALAAAGEYRAAISAVSRWIELDPLHEPAHRFLMLLHAWAGDRPGAIEVYRNCVTAFDEELGVAPLEETTELYEAILDEDLPPAPGVRRRVRAETARGRRPGTDLIDRATELDGLVQALGRAANGGTTVALTGAAWMGKTRLLEELMAEAADRGWGVLVGRSFRMEQELPYGVTTQVLRSAATRLDGGALRTGVPGWARSEVGGLLPELGEPTTLPDPHGELRLLEAIHTVLSLLAGTSPYVLILDDAQWVDTSSAAVFSFLSRRIGDLPILMVVAARDRDDLHPAIAEIVESADLTIAIQPLGIRELAPLVGGDEAAAESLRERTGGIPLLAADAVGSEGVSVSAAPGMARYLEARLRDVGDLGRQVLTAAAVLNGSCDAELLKQTSGRSEEEVVDAVEELVANGLLREVPESDALGFSLDALERVAYDSTSLVRRRLLHRRAARALGERPHARTDTAVAAAVAAHHRAAGDPEAATWYRLAGDLARAVYANDSARQFYEASLALGDPDTATLRLALGELAMAEGQYERARWELTLAAARDAAFDGVIDHRRGEVERLLGRFVEAEKHFRRSLDSHPMPAEVLADWALLAHRTGDSAKATELAERAQNAAVRIGDPRQLSRVRNILAVVTPDHAQALAHVEEAVRLAGDDELLRMSALNNKALLLAESGHSEEPIELVGEAIALAANTGHRHRQAALLNQLADLHHRAGQEDLARDTLTKAVTLFADIDAGDFEPELWLLSRW